MSNEADDGPDDIDIGVPKARRSRSRSRSPSRSKSPSVNRSPPPKKDTSPQPMRPKKRSSREHDRSKSPQQPPTKTKYRSRSPKRREEGEVKEFKSSFVVNNGPQRSFFGANQQGFVHVNPRGPSSSSSSYPFLHPSPFMATTMFPYGSLIVLLVDDNISPSVFEKEWKSVFHRHRYQMYDYLYPFRIASRTILRQNPGYRQKTGYSDVQTEGLTLHLGRETAKFMNENFIFDYFNDWMTNLKPHQKERIVIFGLSTGRGSQIAIQRIRQMGGIVISTPSIAGDVHVHAAKDVDDFLRSLIQPLVHNSASY